MKLIFCPACHDVVKLVEDSRSCQCTASYGKYLKDGLSVEIGGRAIPIGIHNSSFALALQLRPEEGQGEKFEAFVIPENCSTVRQV